MWRPSSRCTSRPRRRDCHQRRTARIALEGAGLVAAARVAIRVQPAEDDQLAADFSARRPGASDIRRPPRRAARRRPGRRSPRRACRHRARPARHSCVTWCDIRRGPPVCEHVDGCESVDGGVEALQDAIATEGDERIEQRRRRGAAGDGNADGHEQVARLPAVRLGELAHGWLQLVRLERDGPDLAGDRLPRGAEGGEGRRAVPALRHEHGRVDRDRVHPQEPDEIAGRGERRQALLDDRHERSQLLGRRDPIDAAGLAICLEERQQTLDEVLWVEPPHPLAVEPLEPFPVEDRATLLDVLQVEPPGEVVERRGSPPRVPVDQPSRDRKLTSASGRKPCAR